MAATGVSALTGSLRFLEAGAHCGMSFAQVIAELPKLTRPQRHELELRLFAIKAAAPEDADIAMSEPSAAENGSASLRAFFGSCATGDPAGADAARIETDLAREAGRGL